MKLPVNVAAKLLLLANGDKVPASQLRHSVITELIAEGIIHKPGKLKSNLQITDTKQLELFLQNRFSINDLKAYVETYNKENLSRADLIAISTDSKLRSVRSFKGFLINCYSPLQVQLNGEALTLHPTAGMFNFIYDFENFIPENDITVVGIENPENFRHIERQRYLFTDIKPLFVSRYPQNQSKDLIKWLQSIPNHYLHFGDLDFAGIGIYLHEFKKYLHDKASFFVPDNIESLIKKTGSKKRYDEQKINFSIEKIEEKSIRTLYNIINTHKKGLDQEIFSHKSSGQHHTY